MEPRFRILIVMAMSALALSACGGAERAAAPTLTIESPKEGLRFTGSSLTVSGTATPDAKVTILGGSSTYAGDDGAWTTKVEVEPGEFTVNASASLYGVEGLGDSARVTRVRTAQEQAALARVKAERRRRERAANRLAERRERRERQQASQSTEEDKGAAAWLRAESRPSGPAVGPCEQADTGAALLLRGSVTSGITLALSEDAVSVEVGSLTYIATPLYDDRSTAAVAAYRTGGDQLDMRAVNGFARDNTSLPQGGSQAGIDAAFDCLEQG